MGNWFLLGTFFLFWDLERRGLWGPRHGSPPTDRVQKEDQREREKLPLCTEWVLHREISTDSETLLVWNGSTTKIWISMKITTTKSGLLTDFQHCEPSKCTIKVGLHIYMNVGVSHTQEYRPVPCVVRSPLFPPCRVVQSKNLTGD